MCVYVYYIYVYLFLQLHKYRGQCRLSPSTSFGQGRRVRLLFRFTDFPPLGHVVQTWLSRINALGLQVHKQHLLQGLKYTNRAHFWLGQIVREPRQGASMNTNIMLRSISGARKDHIDTRVTRISDSGSKAQHKRGTRDHAL